MSIMDVAESYPDETPGEAITADDLDTIIGALDNLALDYGDCVAGDLARRFRDGELTINAAAEGDA